MPTLAPAQGEMSDKMAMTSSWSLKRTVTFVLYKMNRQKSANQNKRFAIRDHLPGVL
jgi:hypothetical protein